MWQWAPPLVEGMDMRKSQKSPSSEPLTQRGTHLYVSLRNHCNAAKMSKIFQKGRYAALSLCNHISSQRSVSCQTKIGFEPRFGAFLANSILGRLVAPQCESHSPHYAASG